MAGRPPAATGVDLPRPARRAPPARPAMKLSTRILLAFAVFLTGITFLHGGLNHGWFEDRVRARLVVAHLPVT